MITVASLKKAGFIAGDWVPMDDGMKYREWRMELVRTGIILGVEEDYTPGEPAVFHSFICPVNGEDVYLQGIDSVTKLIQLKELIQ